MHRIRSINTIIEVTDLDSGYEINDILNEIFDKEAAPELEALFDSKSSPSAITVYDSLDVQIILDDVFNLKNSIKDQLLTQLELHLSRHIFNSKLSIGQPGTDYEAGSPVNDRNDSAKARHIPLKDYYLHALIGFFRTGSAGLISSSVQEALDEQLMQIIHTEPEKLISEIAYTINTTPGSISRIANYFSLKEIKDIIKYYLKSLNADTATVKEYIGLIRRILGISHQMIEKIYLLQVIGFIHKKGIGDLAHELKRIEDHVEYYMPAKDIGKIPLSILLNEILNAHGTYITSSLLQKVLNEVYNVKGTLTASQTRTSKEKKSKETLENILIRKDIRQSSLQAAAYDEKYILFILRTFEFIIAQGSLPYWIRDDKDELTIFKEALKMILTDPHNEVIQRIRSIHTDTADADNISSFFDVETQLAFLNIIDNDTAYRIEVLQHYFIKYNNHVKADPVKYPFINDILQKGFNYYKGEIIRFLIDAYLVRLKYATLKHLFFLFIIELAKHIDKEEAISVELRYLFDNNKEWNILNEDIRNHDHKKISRARDIRNRPFIPGSDQVEDIIFYIRHFLAPDFLSLPVAEGAVNEDMLSNYKMTFSQLAQTGYFDLSTAVRMLLLRKIQSKTNSDRSDWAYFMFNLVTSVSAKPDGNEEAGMKAHDIPANEYYGADAEFWYKHLIGLLERIEILTGKLKIKPEVMQAILRMFSEITGMDARLYDTLRAFIHHVRRSKISNIVSFVSNTGSHQWQLKFLEIKQILNDLILSILATDKNVSARQELTKLIADNMDVYHARIMISKEQQVLNAMTLPEKNIYNSELFLKIRERYAALPRNLNPEKSTTSTTLSGVDYSIVLDISGHIQPGSSFELSLKQSVIQLSREKGMSVRSFLYAILDDCFRYGQDSERYGYSETLFYRTVFVLYELLLQSDDIAEIPRPEAEKQNTDSRIFMVAEEEPEQTQLVSNAGLVICAPFLSMLFQRLDLLNEKKEFIDDYCINRAVFILNYLSYGDLKVREYHLTLNNVLCHVPKNFIYDFSIRLTKKEEDTCQSLLENICDQWSALKSTSPDGLRYNFLMRDGSLSFDGSSYKLVVAKKPYDLLLTKIPWTIGTIKLPWMKEFLFTEWA